jgi:hypothetical protein
MDSMSLRCVLLYMLTCFFSLSIQLFESESLISSPVGNLADGASRTDDFYLRPDIRGPRIPRLIRDGEFQADTTGVILGHTEGGRGVVGYVEERGGPGARPAGVGLGLRRCTFQREVQSSGRFDILLGPDTETPWFRAIDC